MPDNCTPLDLRTIYLAFRSVASPPAFVLLADTQPKAPLRAAGCRLAGHAVLLILSRTEEAKDAVRAGWCDFLVTTLDEALRILKLAVRRSSAAGVVLCADPEAVLRECAERGIQPDLLDTQAPVLLDRGAVRVEWRESLRTGEQWVEWHSAPAHSEALASVDAAVAAKVLSGDAEKLRWLAHAPHELGRAGAYRRGLPMNAGELAAFHQLYATGSVADTVSLEVDGEALMPRQR